VCCVVSILEQVGLLFDFSLCLLCVLLYYGVDVSFVVFVCPSGCLSSYLLFCYE